MNDTKNAARGPMTADDPAALRDDKEVPESREQIISRGYGTPEPARPKTENEKRR